MHEHTSASESGGDSILTMPVLINQLTFSNRVQDSRKVCVELGILLHKLFMIWTWFSKVIF